MGIKNKTEGIKSIRAEVSLRGTKYVKTFVADVGSLDGHKRIRIRRGTRAECERAVLDWYDEHNYSGDTLAAIPPSRLYDCAAAIAQLEAAKSKTTLTAIVSDWLMRNNAVPTSLSAAFTEYLQHFNPDQQKYVRVLKYRVGSFVAVYGAKYVSQITAADCTTWLKQFNTPKTYNNYLQDLKTFLNWCAKKVRRYCAENPIVELEKKQITYKEPEYLHPPEVRKLFAAALGLASPQRERAVLFLAIKFFSGMRSCEVARLQPEDIADDLSSVIIRKPKGYTKGIRPRTFVTEQTFRDWLAIVDWKKELSNLGEWLTEHLLVNLGNACGVKVPRNAARHTFISYHRAKYNNPAVTSGVCGTSEAMQAVNYMSPTFKAEADDFFAITPASLGAMPPSENPSLPSACNT